MREEETQKHMSWRWPIIILLATLCLAGGITAYFVVFEKEPWPAHELIEDKALMDYPIYYPSTLPKGFSYEKGSFKPSDVATIYILNYDEDKKLFISNQPTPKEVVFKDFYDRLLKNKADVTSSEGKAVTGQIDNAPIGSLVTEKTWVIVRAPSGIEGAVLTDIISSLRKL